MSAAEGKSAASAAAATKRYAVAKTPQAKAKAAKSVARNLDRLRKSKDNPDAQ